MTANDDTSPQAPATKEDIRILMEGQGKMYIAMQQWKDDLLDEMDATEQRMKLHFDAAVENVRHDLAAVRKDEIEVIKDKQKNHEKRIGRVEDALGIAA